MTALPRRILERMGAVAKEAVRRRVWITAGAYIAVSIGAIEIAGAVTGALLFPSWTPRLVTFLLILGFPIVVVLAWLFDVPERVKRAALGHVRHELRTPINALQDGHLAAGGVKGARTSRVFLDDRS